jgi:hypothetical protein
MIRNSAVPCAFARSRASTSGTSSFSSPCNTSNGRGASRRAAAVGLNRESSAAHDSNLGGKSARRIAPSSRARSSSRRGCSTQGSNDAGAPSVATPPMRSSVTAWQRASEPPLDVPTRNTVDGDASASRWSTAARRSSAQPPSEKSPSLSPQPRNVKVMATQPRSCAARSQSSGNVSALKRASSGPAGKPWHTMTPGGRSVVRALGSTRWRANLRPPEGNEPFTLASPAGYAPTPAHDLQAL